MKISIAMATYNGAQYIQAQLLSFIDQTRQPDELVISDDCSTDDTASIVREFSKTAPFKVEFYRNERNLGYCGNFNAALMRATGDIVFLSDQDDVWFPEKVEYIAAAAEQNPEALVVMNDAALTDGDLNEVGLTKIGQIISAGFTLDRFVMGCCCAIRRELLDYCMPIPKGFKSHDNWLVWLANGLNARVVVSDVLQYYRRHDGNQSNTIANRVTKVNRTHALIHSVRWLFEGGRAEQTRTQLEQLRIFVDGIHRIKLLHPEWYNGQLQTLENRYRQRITTIEQRMEVRRRFLFPRIIAVGILFVKGGYRNTSGLRAMLQDIVKRDV